MALNVPVQVVVPAYGRDYKSYDALMSDMAKGLDFRLEPQGQYFSIRDIDLIAADGTTHIEFRYNNRITVAIVSIESIKKFAGNF